jgi:hypothetical protein
MARIRISLSIFLAADLESTMLNPDQIGQTSESFTPVMTGPHEIFTKDLYPPWLNGAQPHLSPNTSVEARRATVAAEITGIEEQEPGNDQQADNQK